MDGTSGVNGARDAAGEEDAALVAEARSGDRAAGDRLAARYLPLVYNVVGRALNGHPDVDDVVQETMLRALSGLPSLRDPARFRSWLVAIAMNQVRTRWSGLGHRPAPLEEGEDPADPAADFVGLTILRLELSGQRRETAEATRWLDGAERDALSLWWLEATGALSRSELAEALGLPPAHAAVRVQRVKNQLDVGRTVVRALAADPRCPALTDLLGDWDGAPTPLWRKRIARHVRGCARCSEGSRGLVPPEGLLSGLALVPPLYDGGQPAASLATTTAASAAPASSGTAAATAGKAAGLLAGGAAVTALAVLVWPAAPPQPAPRGAVTAAPAPPPSPPAPTGTGPATPSATPPEAPSAPPPEPARTAVRPSAAPPPSSAAPATGAAVPAPDGVVARVNALRAANGCPGLTTDPRLTGVARRHAADMAARGGLGHTDAAGRGPGDRVEAAGYAWSAVGETIATGTGDPAEVVARWRDSPGPGDSLLNCDFVHVGVGVADSPSGPYWTQVLAAPG